MNAQIAYMGVLHTFPADKSKEPVVLKSVTDLNGVSRWYRGEVEKFLVFFPKLAAQNTPVDQPMALTDEHVADYYIHTKNTRQGLCSVIIAQKGYPERVITELHNKIIHEISVKYSQSAIASATTNSLHYPELDEYIKQYQNPQEADKIMKIQNELDSTKTILHQTLESVLERGEKVDNLVQKSNDLSATSKMFYTQAKKQNSCCNVM